MQNRLVTWETDVLYCLVVFVLYLWPEYTYSTIVYYMLVVVLII